MEVILPVLFALVLSGCSVFNGSLPEMQCNCESADTISESKNKER
jgi:hypothetical protein